MSQPRKPLSIVTFIAIIVGGVIGWAAVNQLMHPNSSTSIEEELVTTSNEANKTLPKIVDSETRWDTTTAGPGKMFFYLYMLVNRTKDDLDATRLAEGKRPEIINGYKTTPQMKGMWDAGVVLHYQYFDKNGVLITDIVVDPSDLK